MEISLSLQQGKFTFKNLKNSGNDFIVAAAGGRKPKLNWFKQAALGRQVYCADRGVEICLDAGIKPQLLCGDADSAGAYYLRQARDEKIKTLLFNPAKDDTDLQLLLQNLPQDKNLLITGIWGGRFDHLYSNVFSLYAYKKNTGAAVIMADETEIMVLLTPGESLEFMPNISFTALSLLPLADSRVSLTGTRWPLDNTELLLSRPYAVSNEITDAKVTAACHDGCIGFYLKTAGKELL